MEVSGWRQWKTDTRRAIRRWIVGGVRFALRLLYVFPIRRGRVVFTVHKGLGCWDSPKFISEYLSAHYPGEVECIWGFRHPERQTCPPRARAVRVNSPAWFFYCVTAQVIVINMNVSRCLPKRRGQLILDTWHGGGAYKRVGYERRGLREAECRSSQRAIDRVDLFLSSSEAFSRFALREDLRYQGAVLNCGLPRNDILFLPAQREAAAEKVRASLGLEGIVILYAPTFRGDAWMGYKTDLGLPYASVLAAVRRRTGKNAAILKRAHPGCFMADGTEEGVLDATDWPDMQELLCTADILITDYSSCIWDYALLGRPCFLYTPDLAEYEAERGLCTPVETWPGIVCRDKRELLAALETYDAAACARKAADHLRALGSYETGTAAEQVCAQIMSHIRRD